MYGMVQDSARHARLWSMKWRHLMRVHACTLYRQTHRLLDIYSRFIATCRDERPSSTSLRRRHAYLMRLFRDRCCSAAGSYSSRWLRASTTCRYGCGPTPNRLQLNVTQPTPRSSGARRLNYFSTSARTESWQWLSHFICIGARHHVYIDSNASVRTHNFRTISMCFVVLYTPDP